MIYPVEIKALNDKEIFIKYSDGLQGTINLSFLFKNFSYEDLKNEELFKTIYIDEVSKDIYWEGHISLCKDTLYNHLKLIKLAENLKLDVNKL